MGGAQVIVLASGFVRAKVIAMILGASGVGLVGIFNAFSGNVSVLAGWGLGTAGVRLVAGADDETKPAKQAAVRRMGWILSLLGLVLGLLAFLPVSLATFDSNRYAIELAIVALAVPCIIASSAWSALLQASGRIASLAKVQMVSAFTGLAIGLPAIYFWGTIGIAMSLFLAAAVPAGVLWRVASTECPARGSAAIEAEDLRQLLKVGGALMIVGWIGQLSGYLVRLAIIRQEGLEASGYYQAAFAISGSLPGFVFAAMGADFFPRIAGAKSLAESEELLEKQIKAGMLLGVPLIAVLLTLGRPCVHLLYARDFDPVLTLLSWMTWGVFLRLISWPLGFWLLARNSPKSVIMVECLSNSLTVALPLLLMPFFGLTGAALAFFWSSFIYAIIVISAYRLKSGIWPARGAALWVAVAVASLILAQLWSSSQVLEYAGLMPSVIIGAFSLWKYRKIMRI
jgi:PST family polysaccharide transporter